MTAIWGARNLPLRNENPSEVPMPTYSYSCGKCGKRFTRTESISAHGKRKPACPKCGSQRVNQVLRPFFAKTSKKS